jgi:hypothetical protein
MYEVPIESTTVSENIRDIQLSLELAQNVSLAALVKMGPQRTFHRVVLAATIQMFLQMTGVNAITSYASTIYEASTYPSFQQFPSFASSDDRSVLRTAKIDFAAIVSV